MKACQYIFAALAAALLFSGKVQAQDASLPAAADSTAFSWTGGDLQRKGSRLAIDGKKLPKDVQTLVLSDIDGMDLNPLWRQYARERNAGLWTLVGGSVVFAGGMAYGGILMVGTVIVIPLVVVFAEIFTLGNANVDEILSGTMEEMSGRAKIGGAVGLAGFAAMTAGTVLLCVGNHKLRRTVDYCNSVGAPREASFNFGPTASGGIGLTFNF